MGRMSNGYVRDLLNAQLAIEEARVAVEESMRYSVSPGLTPEQTGRDGVARSVVNGLESCRKEVAGFIEVLRSWENPILDMGDEE